MNAQETTPESAVAEPATAPAQHAWRAGDRVRQKSSRIEFTLDDVNQNPNYEADDEYYASGTTDGGTLSVDVMSPDDLELVMTAAAARARKAPTAAQIAPQVATSLHSAFGDVVVTIDTTDIDGPGEISAYGRTADGLRVNFTVTISAVEETL